MLQSIRTFFAEIKAQIGGFLGGERAGDMAMVALVVLVGLGGFGLGRLSMTEVQRGSVYLAQAASSVAPEPIPPGGQFVASRSGTKYYYPWCGGAKSISQKNLIWFTSEEKAKKAGYAPASNCKGLSVPK